MKTIICTTPIDHLKGLKKNLEKRGKLIYKPSIKIKEDPLFSEMDLNFKNTVYFGDRENDELFAKKMKFEFIKVKNMKIVNE